MDPIGLNVGAFYLTALREDDWLADSAYAWAVREATTGDSIGEVVLTPDGAVRTVGAESEGLTTAREAVERFGASL
ncbi:hypothetical protein [Tsukamurella sp. 1534]|uniref:hypothetical protein n=1 Tax=Tsukamurella sp. 1534 TaxID=1151061 RepID=UPI000312D002|nr:hypothetical protein [Tsukamurella sp. 1534]